MYHNQTLIIVHAPFSNGEDRTRHEQDVCRYLYIWIHWLFIVIHSLSHTLSFHFCFSPFFSLAIRCFSCLCDSTLDFTIIPPRKTRISTRTLREKKLHTQIKGTESKRWRIMMWIRSSIYFMVVFQIRHIYEWSMGRVKTAAVWIFIVARWLCASCIFLCWFIFGFHCFPFCT